MVGVVCASGSRGVSQFEGAEVVRTTRVVLWEAMGCHHGNKPVRVEHHQCWHLAVHSDSKWRTQNQVASEIDEVHFMYELRL